VEFEPELTGYYWKRSGMLNIQTKRGCPYECIYCSYPHIDGRCVRTMDPEIIAENILRAKRDYGINYLFFTDSVFNIRPEYNVRLAETLIRRGTNVAWGAYFSPRGIDAEQMRLFRASGLTHIEFGTESFCDRTLEAYGKRFTFGDVVRASRLALDNGVYYAHFLILGGYGDTREHVRETTDDAGQSWIEFPHDEVKPGANLRLKGEEMKAGSIVMPAGLVLTPEWIGMAASLGHAELLVRRIRVAVFSTGDELAAPGTPGPLDTGRIYNANSPLIAALAQSWGAQVEDLGILPDNPEAIRSAFLDLGSRVDFIVTSGGVGEGEHDYTSKVFAELGGDLSHHHISQRPGKPFSFGRLGEAGPWFIALPGNPVAAAVSAKLYLHRAVRLAAGALSDEIGGKVVPASTFSPG